MRHLSLSILLALLCLACLSLAGCGDDGSLRARTERLAAFSVTLPDGWSTNIPSGIECTRGRCTAGFSRVGGSRSAVTVSVIPSLGKSLDEIIGESMGNSASQDAVMRVTRREEACVEFEGTIKGNEARLIATMDAAQKEVGILMLVGDDEKQLMEVASTVRMVNPRLDFGLGAGAR